MSSIQIIRRFDPDVLVLLDENDRVRLGHISWKIDKDGYAVHRSKKYGYLVMHREIMMATKDQIVDHINGNKTDNRRCNLRLANKSTNGMNRGPNRNNALGLKGVSKLGNGFRAAIVRDGKQYHLGVFNSENEAAAAYIGAAVILHGEFART
jgi:hypothetical protein